MKRVRLELAIRTVFWYAKIKILPMKLLDEEERKVKWEWMWRSFQNFTCGM